MDPKPPRGHLFLQTIQQKNFQLQIPILSKNEVAPPRSIFVERFYRHGYVPNISKGWFDSAQLFRVSDLLLRTAHPTQYQPAPPAQ